MINRLKELLFQNKGARQTVAKNVFWLSISQIGSRFIRAIIIIYAARILGAAEYGIFSYILGLAGFFTIFSNVGVDTILTREASHQKESAPKYFANAFWIKIFFLSITAVAIIFFAPYFSNIKGAETLLPLIAVLIFFDNIRELCVAYFRAQEKMEYEALVTTFTNISITVFGFLILAKFKTSQAVTIMYISGAGAGMFLAAYIIRREFKKVFRNFSTKLIKEILNASWAVSLYGIAASFMLNTDVVMLGWFRSANEIGF